MKRVVALVVIFVFVMSTAAAFAASSSKSTSSGQSGWQSVYDDISSWTWGTTEKKSTKKK